MKKYIKLKIMVYSKQNKVKLILIILCLQFLLIYSIIFNVNAWPGEGDCSEAHEITYIEVPSDKDALITLDGNPSESFWTEASNEKGQVQIKLAMTKIDTEIPEVFTLNATFIMNKEYLYILLEWVDLTPQYEESGNKDGLAFCWDINTLNFSAYYVSDMNTMHMGGGRVDAWRWAYSSFKEAGGAYYCLDDCFDEDGWIQGNPEISNIEVAYSVTEDSYTLELSRRLITNDEYDVQFDHSGVYKFNLALFNDTKYEDHAISWTYAIELEKESAPIIPGFLLEYLILFSCIITILNILIKKARIENRRT